MKKEYLIFDKDLAFIYRIIAILEATENEDIKNKALKELKELIINIDLNQ
jgi:hypothetical protein